MEIIGNSCVYGPATLTDGHKGHSVHRSTMYIHDNKIVIFHKISSTIS